MKRTRAIDRSPSGQVGADKKEPHAPKAVRPKSREETPKEGRCEDVARQPLEQRRPAHGAYDVSGTVLFTHVVAPRNRRSGRDTPLQGSRLLVLAGLRSCWSQ